MTSVYPRHSREDVPHDDRDTLVGHLYREHHHSLVRYLGARFGKSRSDSEDIIQSVFMKLTNHPDIRGILDRRAYVFTLACNIAIDTQRKETSLSRLQDQLHVIAETAPGADAGSEKILLDRERLAHIEVALKRMPKMRRRIFLLIRIEGLSVREVASQFAISEAAVYKHVARALHDCAAVLERIEQKAGKRA